MSRKKKNDDWVEGLIGLGLGVLALYFLKKLSESSQIETQKTCVYCGYSSSKWARACPNCRNTFPL